MCGIVGAVSTRNIVPILVQGLERLEYRGYDSCGVAVYAQDAPIRSAPRAQHGSRVAELAAASQQQPSCKAHWALPTPAGPRTARPAVHNAHPHFSHGSSANASRRPGNIALVHNGIIENHDELRNALQAQRLWV